MIMFKEWPPLNPGSGGVTESSEEMRKRASDILEVKEARKKTAELRGLLSSERLSHIHKALEEKNLKRALVLVDVAPTEEQIKLHRAIYDELLRKGEFYSAARLAQMKTSAHPESTGRHDFTGTDVRLAAIQAYHSAKENPMPNKRMKPPPGLFEGYIPNDYKTPDAELIKREFGLTDEDIGPSLPKAA